MDGLLIRTQESGSTADAGLALEMERAADRIKALMRSSIIDVGVELLRIKGLTPHGMFQSWVRDELAITPRSAENYMAAAGLVAENENFSRLGSSTLYLLASPGTPEATRIEIAKRLDAEVSISGPDLREIITDARYRERDRRKTEKLGRRSKKKSFSGAKEPKAQRKKDRELAQRQALRDAAVADLAALLRRRLGDDLAEFVRLAKVVLRWDTALISALVDA